MLPSGALPFAAVFRGAAAGRDANCQFLVPRWLRWPTASSRDCSRCCTGECRQCPRIIAGFYEMIGRRQRSGGVGTLPLIGTSQRMRALAVLALLSRAYASDAACGSVSFIRFGICPIELRAVEWRVLRCRPWSNGAFAVRFWALLRNGLELLLHLSRGYDERRGRVDLHHERRWLHCPVG